MGLFSRKKSKFIYASPLGSETIRLVRFTNQGPVRRAEKPSLEISTHALVESLDYHALSYTWGPPEGTQHYKNSDRQSIFIGGEKFYVFPNLYDVLVQMRESRVAEYYWIDAICIDQKNEAEKAVQVSMMDRIYVTATQVDIWVGKGTRDSVQVFELVMKLADMPWDTMSTKLQLVDDEAFQSYGLPTLTPENWGPFVNFFDRNWFKRVWVIQEAALARKAIFFWGGVTIPWEKVRACAAALIRTKLDIGLTRIARQLEPDGPETRKPIASTVNRITLMDYLCMNDTEVFTKTYLPQIELLTGTGAWKKSASPLLAFAMSRCRAFDATDQRDKVFALLGIANYAASSRGAAKTTIVVDYGKGSTVAVVFTRAIKTILEDCNHLGLLAEARKIIKGDDKDRHHPMPNLPSWVPDFSGESLSNPIIHRPGAFLFDPSRYGQFGSQGFCIVDTRLNVKAVQVGTVSAVSAPLSDFFVNGKFESIAAILLQLGTNYAPTGELGMDAFWRTLVCNADESGNPANIDMRASFGHWLTHRILASLTLHNDAGDKCLAAFRGMKNYRALVNRDGAHAGEMLPSLEMLEDRLRKSGMLPWPDGRMSQDFTVSQALELNRLSHRYHGLVTMMAAYRRVFLTDQGYLGVGVDTTAVGDSVWVISSCPVPLILRTATGVSSVSQTTYHLMGDSYVHGIMHGEAVPEGMEWNEICIE